MSESSCPFLEAVLNAAAGGGKLRGELERHVAGGAGCPECADAWLVEGFLLAGAAQLEPVALPDAEAVYWRASLRARIDGTERATLPIAVLGKVSRVIAGVVLGGLALSQGRPALGWLHGLGVHAGAALRAAASTPILSGSVAASSTGPAAVAVTACVLAAPLLLWGLYMSWVEE